MNIANIKQFQSGLNVVTSADFTTASGKTKEVYFAVPTEYKGLIVPDSAAFFPLGLTLSMKLGEDLFIEGRLPEVASHRWNNIVQLLTGWEVGLQPITVHAEPSVKEVHEAKRVGSFFSGGVDSFYTFLKNKRSGEDAITHLLLLHGFDIMVDDQEKFDDVLKTTEAIAKEEGVIVIPVTTNLRDLTDEILEWGFSHGAALASVSLLLRKGLHKVYIPSSYTFDTLFPWGSHPDLDPLWSTETLTIVHDGCDVSRLEKTKFIAGSQTVLDHLRVCWKNVAGEYNCGMCPKCLRTMIDLEITGKLGQSKVFAQKIDMEVLKRADARGHGDRIFYTQSLAELEKSNTNPELQETLKYLLYEKKYTSVFQRVRDFTGAMDKRYNKGRLYRFMAKRGLI